LRFSSRMLPPMVVILPQRRPPGLAAPQACSPMSGILAKKLARIFPLSAEELAVLERAVASTKNFTRGEDLVRTGTRPRACTLIVSGFACRYKDLPDGGRQIVSLLIPGDICDLQSFILERMDHSIGALDACTAGYIPHATVREITETYPRIARAFWKDTLIEAAAFREHIVSLGRRPAYTRIAHALCEVMTRLEAVGLTENGSCRFPVTQVELSDALGLSVVHVNRTLQRLRADGLISLGGDTLTVHDWERLKEAGEFDRSYLHLVPASPSEEVGDDTRDRPRTSRSG
jgi:CRP-like cAMP-binding protein